MAHTVIGFFKDSSDAYKAVDELMSRGFENSNIDVTSAYGSYQNVEHRDEHTGKVGKFFKSLFSDDDDSAHRYSDAARDNSMVTVHTFSEDEAERAANILDDCGAIDVNENGFTDSQTYGRSTEVSGYSSDNATGLSSDRDFDRTADASIPIIEEEIKIGKREVRRGGVKIRSRIIERPVEETLRLREERVRVERNTVNRDATEAELENFREETIEINEYGEEAVVSKQARVVEEVRVGKEVEERNETVRETERKTEVEVENFEKSAYQRG